MSGIRWSKMAGWLVLAGLVSGAGAKEFDLTKGMDEIKNWKAELVNIEVLPPGVNGGVIAKEPKKFSGVRFPVRNLWDSQQGSLSLTFVPVSDMSFFQGGSINDSMTLLEVIGTGKNRFSIGAGVYSGYQIVSVNLTNGQKTISKIINIKDWKKGDKHTVTFSWNASQIKIEVDGKVLFEEKWEIPMFDTTAINLCGYNNTYFMIRSLSVADQAGK